MCFALRGHFLWILYKRALFPQFRMPDRWKYFSLDQDCELRYWDIRTKEDRRHETSLFINILSSECVEIWNKITKGVLRKMFCSLIYLFQAANHISKRPLKFVVRYLFLYFVWGKVGCVCREIWSELVLFYQVGPGINFRLSVWQQGLLPTELYFKALPRDLWKQWRLIQHDGSLDKTLVTQLHEWSLISRTHKLEAKNRLP